MSLTFSGQGAGLEPLRNEAVLLGKLGYPHVIGKVLVRWKITLVGNQQCGNGFPIRQHAFGVYVLLPLLHG